MEVLSPFMNLGPRSSLESRTQESGARSSDSSTDFSKSLGAKSQDLGTPPGFGRQAPKLPEPSDHYSSQQTSQTPTAPTPVEQKVERTQGKMVNVALDQRVDDLSQRQSIMKFIKKMQQELGVSAAEIVAAFSTLTPQELMQPPQQSVDKLIQALPLTENNKVVAKQYFLEMVGGSKNPSVGEFLKASDRQISLQVMSEEEVKKAELQSSVDRMQQSFFAGASSARVKATDVSTQPTLAPSVESMETFTGTAQKVDTPLEAGIEMNSDMWSQLNPQSAEGKVVIHSSGSQGLPFLKGELPKDLQQAQQVTQKTQGAVAYGLQSNKKITGSDEALKSLAQSVEQNPSAMVDGAEVSLEQFARQDLQVSSEPMGALSQVIPAESLSNEDLTSQDQGQASEGGEQLMGLMSDRMQESRLASDLKPTFAIATQPSPEQSAANIRDLVQNASLLAKDGGGEMKVQMSPEGMGQVSLKVAIEGGSVQVEMITESDEVKKLLEKGLNDLKSNLSSQNLKVEGIRIDTASDVSRQLAERHDEAQKQFAQQFMENFRQENNEWRRGFYDMGGPRMVSSQRDAAESQTGQVTSGSSRKSSSSRRLDLVA